jgi:hypothetical protein
MASDDELSIFHEVNVVSKVSDVEGATVTKIVSCGVYDKLVNLSGQYFTLIELPFI